MSKFEENLDASISKVLNEAKLSDELYKKYQQFVGALDALPQDQIAADRLGSDIHDQFGRIKPFSQWPTKASRAKSEKVWLTYNQRLQLAQAAKEGGTAPEDPTDDPEFLGQLLDTCVRTSMNMGGLDRNTAFRHCSRQVKRFEQAVRGALTDRGLPKREVEEFTKELLKGMANGKQIDMKDLSVEDRQFIQDLQDSLTYRPKSESVVKEDLDDKDEFKPDCHYCSVISHNSPTININEFHRAHTTIEHMTPKRLQSSHEQYTKSMSYFGFVPLEQGDSYRWAEQKSLKEDIDDRDEFEPCEYKDCISKNAINPKFHDAHVEAAAYADAAYAKNKSWSDFVRNFAAIMSKYGFVKDREGSWTTTEPVKEGYHYGGEYHEVPPETLKIGDLDIKVGDWVELGPVKTKTVQPHDVLDDTDEFGGQEDFPITPVQVTSISDVTERYRDPNREMYLVRLSNHNLLSLPDKSGVRWHGRPKHHVPSWYEEWYAPFTDDVLETYYNHGELRKIDNIEQWFQSQPVKENVDVRGFRMCFCGSQRLTPLDDYPYGHPGTAVKCEDCSNVMYSR